MKLTIENIKYKIGERNFSYSFSTSDSITGVYGDSGAGKTTLFNLISGLLKPLNGKIEFSNNTFYNTEDKLFIPAKKRNIGYVIQDNFLFPHLTVKKNLEYSKPYTKKRPHYVSFQEVVDILDIAHLLGKKPKQLSGGERQRVAIGRALLSQPSLLLLDEPFSNVDCSKRRDIISYLLRINNHFQIPMLIISHYLEDILKLTRNLVVIDDGSVVKSGDIYSILTDGTKPEFIRSRKVQNTAKARFNGFDSQENNYILSFGHNEEVKITSHSRILHKEIPKNSVIQFSFKPDDVVLSLEKHNNSSIHNQWAAVVTDIIDTQDSLFCVLDCGFRLLAEVSGRDIEKLNLHKGQEVFCQLNAKAIDVIHVFDKLENEFEQALQCSQPKTVSEPIG